MKIRHLVLALGLLAVTVQSAEKLSLFNMSVRIRILANEIPVVGFVVSNSSGATDNPPPIRLLVRAAGPSLRKFGMTPIDRVELSVVGAAGAAPRTISTLSKDRAVIAAAAASVGAFAFDEVEGDDAVIIEVPAGALTVHVRSPTGRGGETLIEAYQLP